MTNQSRSSPFEAVGVALVDGDPVVRHERQLMLRSQKFEVRAYGTGAALLADPRSRSVSCVIVDIGTRDCDGQDLLRRMRASGWRGRGILLDGEGLDGPTIRGSDQHGDRVLQRSVGDAILIAAIGASVDRGWSRWTAEG